MMRPGCDSAAKLKGGPGTAFGWIDVIVTVMSLCILCSP
jgi:hypothetical protein